MKTLIQRSFYRLWSLAVLCFSLCPDSQAQNKLFPVREVSNILPASLLSTTAANNLLFIQNDARYTQINDASFPAKVKYKSNYTLVKLSINHASASIPTQAYSYKMVYQLEGSTKIDDTTYNFSVVDSVSIAYNPDSLTAFQDQDVKVYPKLFNAKLSILQFYDANNTGTPVTIPLSTVRQKNLNVELAMQYQLYLKTHYAPADMGLYMLQPNYNATKSVLNIGWLPSNSPYLGKVTPVQYELEWTYVDDYANNLSPALSSSAIRYDFKNNATRVVTDTPGYQIPVVYPRGYLAVRVRMVRVDSNNYYQPIYGPWSLSNGSGYVSSLTGGYNCYYISQAHSGDALNWNYAIQFAEGGKYKHVQSYYDGLLKNRQTITRFNSDPSRLLVTEKIYDYEGRPEITTIPSVFATDSFGYLHNVSLSSTTSLPYAPSDFDWKPTLCPDEYTIPPFTTGSLANRYYSTLNTDTAGMQKFVPRANGYPFVHTQLSPGFSDRVDIMGGAGDSLQIGRRHDVRNQYMSADQSELDRMLGINSGYSSYYTKTVSKDQNGQYSLSLKDFRGRPVLTSLIGAAVDTTKVAIMFNEEVPNDKLFQEDKLANATQLVVGHEKRYDGSLYMDETALTNVQYEYTFAPYPVCTFNNYILGLSVKGDYDYTFIDDCGLVDLHRSGTIGTTGIVISPTAVPSTVSDTVTLKKGKHVINKTLAISTDEIYAAVDSFFAFPGPKCFKTKEEFIKEEVENTPFPCPDSIDNPCLALERRMMEELFPDGKYGHVPGSLPAPNNSNSTACACISIFDKIPPDSLNVRYLGPCVSTALNLVSFTRYGITYSNLASMPRDTFIAIFRNAGKYKYDIARALLPLHPEYCKLANCFIDTFEKRFKSFPDAQAAIKSGYFSLNDIVTKDSQLRSKLSFISGIDDSLKTVWGGRMRMDTVMAEIAFCMNDQTGAYGDARNYFHNDIVNLNFPDYNIRNLYFDKLRSIYFANRAKYKSMSQTNGSNNCSGCSDTAYQIKLIPPPLIPVMYTPTGAFDTSYGSLFSLFASDTTIQQKLKAFLFSTTHKLITDTALQNRYRDTANMYVAQADSTLNAIAVDSIGAKLVNCFSTSTQKGRLQDTLRAMIARGEVHNGVFMPQQIRYAITAAGLSLSGLCHPYLFNYDYYQSGNPSKATCKSGQFYDNVRDFFNGSQILSALKQATTSFNTVSLTWSNTNPFAAQISAKLGTTNIGLRTNYVNADKTTRLMFYDVNGTSTDSVIVTIHSTVGAPYASGQSPFYQPNISLSIDRVSCYMEDPQAQAEGYIGRFMFRIAATRVETYIAIPVTTKFTASGWNNQIEMADEGDNKIEACVACPQFKDIFKGYADTMTAYSAFFGDHPLFIKSLRNFSNYNLKRCFGDDQYRRFLSSCALADSMLIPSYGGYGRMSFSGGSSTFAAFRQTMQNSADSINVLPVVVDSTSSGERAVIDYTSIPYHLLSKFNGIVTSYGGSVAQPVTGSVGILLIPQSSISGATITNVLASTGFTNSTAQSVWVKRGTSKYLYYRYTISASGSPTHAQLSAGIAKVDDNMYANSVHGYWMPNAYATVNKDYYKPQKQQYLRYAYSAQNMSPAKVLDTLQGAVS